MPPSCLNPKCKVCKGRMYSKRLPGGRRNKFTQAWVCPTCERAVQQIPRTLRILDQETPPQMTAPIRAIGKG
jgi:hypothetical protein